ncbi:hypothetical protein [Clostridium gasigenes]|uniref:hypothetical protein n=1 Tax=Clostridium gasigenes TaxID=94869 RepID=UPI001C0B42D7|nr:hypothetical protein [Clostridium gasigenes]MBU3107334.1 hypothetical protein [Clostridium gasigenes]
MKKFLRYMLKPLAIVSVIPYLGIISYRITNEKYLLATSIILYLSITSGAVVKYCLKEKAAPNKDNIN